MEQIKKIRKNKDLSKFLFLSILAAALIFLIPGCSGDPHNERSTHNAISSSTYDFEWADCPFGTSGLDTERLRCGYLTVPENRTEEDGRTLRLAVGVMKAQSPDPKPDAVVFLAGGPGAHSLPTVLATSRLFSDRDFVVYDPRGTGFSEPDMCAWLIGTYRYISALNLSENEADLMKAGARRACRDEMVARGVDLGAFGLSEEAADLEDLRRALNYEQWNLLAPSWGAMVAQAAMQKYPDGVRSVILATPAPMGGLDEVAEAKVPVFATTLHGLFAACDALSECRASFPNLKDEFYSTITALRQDPLIIPIEMQHTANGRYIVNAHDFVTIIRRMLFGGSWRPNIPAAIRAFSSRNIDDAREVVKAIASWGSHSSEGKFYTSLCYNIPASQTDWESAASDFPLLRSIDSWMEVCRYWHVNRANTADISPVNSDIPALMLSGGLDPIIPAESAGGILPGMPNAYPVFFPTGAHGGSVFRSHACFEFLKEFIADPTSPPDTSCVAKEPALKFTLPYIEVAVNPTLLKRYAGKYRSKDSTRFEIVLDGESLFFQPERGPRRVLEAVSDTRFKVDLPGLTTADITFQSKSGGQPKHFSVLFISGRKITAHRVDR